MFKKIWNTLFPKKEHIHAWHFRCPITQSFGYAKCSCGLMIRGKDIDAAIERGEKITAGKCTNCYDGC